MEVDDATDIATYAASNPAAHRAFVLQMFRYLTKQVPYAYGAETVSRLTEEFQQDSFNIQELAARIAVMAAGYGQKR